MLDKMLFSLHWLRLWVLCIAPFWGLVVDLRNAPVTHFWTGANGGEGGKLSSAAVLRLARVLDLEDVPEPHLWTTPAKMGGAEANT